MKPTPQAIRAAEALFYGEFLTEEETAIIIDREMGGWRPIEEIENGEWLVTDGVNISHIAAGEYHGQPGFYFSLAGGRGDETDSPMVDYYDATHFRELPAPPTP